MQKQADEMRFVCRTRVALLCRVLRSVSLLFFSLKSLFSFFFFRSKNKKGHKKTHIKLFWGLLLTKTFYENIESAFLFVLGRRRWSRPIVVTRLFGLVRAHKCCLSFALLVFERFHEAKTSSRRLFSRAIGARASSRR